MVQKISAKRGRPRAYDPATALVRAMSAFWDAGYGRDLTRHAQRRDRMNRPSLYGAFGDKRALYRTCSTAMPAPVSRR